MVTVACLPDDSFLISAHVSSSGFHVCADACSGVRKGNLFVSETQRGSIAPILIGSPCDSMRSGLAPSVNAISMRHFVADAFASCQMKVGGVISAGKMESSWG